MLYEAAYGIGGLFLFAIVVDFLFSLADDPKEPPRLRPRIPLIGHLVGLLLNGTSYYTITGKRTSAEVYTLGIFHYKLYICNSRRMMPVIQRQSKTLSFRPFLQVAAKVFGDADDETHRIFGGSFVDDFRHGMKAALAPGPYLDAQNLLMGEQLIADLDTALSEEHGASQKVKLLAFSRDLVVQASSYGIYGRNHPFRTREVQEAFWKWHSHLAADMAGLGFLTGAGRTARAEVFAAYHEYFQMHQHEGSHLFHERVRILREAGIAEDQVIKQESTFPSAFIVNTVPTLFWAIWELFSRPDVLDETRLEVETQAISGSKQDGFSMDVSALKTRCPLLLSVLEETQRTRHVHANIRSVLSDTLLDGRFLLKKGNYLQMPGQPIHTSAEVYGHSATEFDPYRFVPKKDIGRPSIPPSGFLAWGAPPHLCPARQFATTEILIILAMMAVRADLVPCSGVWEKNPALDMGEVASLSSPKQDTEVKISMRDQWAGKWSLQMGDSLQRIHLASG